MIGWHHPLNEHEFEQTPGDTKRHESLVSMGSQRVRYGLTTKQQQIRKKSVVIKEMQIKIHIKMPLHMYRNVCNQED